MREATALPTKNSLKVDKVRSKMVIADVSIIITSDVTDFNYVKSWAKIDKPLLKKVAVGNRTSNLIATTNSQLVDALWRK